MPTAQCPQFNPRRLGDVEPCALGIGHCVLQTILRSCMQGSQSSVAAVDAAQVQQARDALDAWVREVVNWHFDPATGCPFWLERAKTLGFDPREEIHGFNDLHRFGGFEDEWLRGGPVQRWVPKALTGKPVYVFETGGTTGTPKTRINIDDF